MMAGMLLLLTLACADPEDSAEAEPPAACADAPDVTWDNFGYGFFLTYCNSCHSRNTADRRGAPDGVDFDTEADLVQWKERVNVRVLQEGTMPLGGGVYSDELELLQVMLACHY